MRRALYSTVAVFLAIVPVGAHAADVSEAGAKKIEDALTQYLPQKVIDGGFISVTPGTQRYELKIDLQPLIKDFAKDVTINGLKPLVHYLTPQDDGQWKVEMNDHFNVNGQLTAEGKANTFTYIIDKAMFDGVFDPSISYFSKAHGQLENGMFASKGGPTSVSATFEKLVSDMTAAKSGDGVIDVHGTFDAGKLSELIEDGQNGQTKVSADAMTGTVAIEGLGANAVRDLVVFGLDLVKANPDKLTAEQDGKLKSLIEANIPFVNDLSEEINFENIKASTQGLDASLAQAGYTFGFNGIKPDSEMSVGFTASDPEIPAGLLPPGTDPALPQSVSFGMAVTGLNLEGVLAYMVEHADFTKSDPLTPAQSAELGKIVLPDGLMHIEFRDVAAKSDVYDVALTGTMVVNPDKSDRPEADVTITAHDFDKTISFLQENANAVPQFGQAAFMALAFKGFGKTGPDGSIAWTVKLDGAGSVTINGQPMKM
jgi:hypothetical protein